MKKPSRVKLAAFKKALAERGITADKFRKLTEAGRFVRRELPHCEHIANGFNEAFLTLNGAPLHAVAARAATIEKQMVKTAAAKPPRKSQTPLTTRQGTSGGKSRSLRR